MPPAWLQSLAQIWIALSIAGALYVLADIATGHRQKMRVMNIVWPLTVLYWGPLGLPFYRYIGRKQGNKPMWQASFAGASHCGAGCALGDFAGDWLAFGTGFTLAGSELGGKYLLAFLFAYLFGIAFQYFSIAPMRGLNLREGIRQALKADTLSIAAYEVGMFGWMGVRAWLYPDLQPTDLSYWFMMQVAMMLGFLTTYPVNWRLIRRGVKEKM